MALNTGLNVTTDRLLEIMGSIKELTSHDVLVGFPESGPPRKDSKEPTNAYIAFIQEHGSPARNIPARSFMVPGVIAVRAQAEYLLQKAALAGLQGEKDKAMVYLNQLGLVAVGSVQRAITRGEGWPPLSPRTLAARRARGVRRTHPLIDTGQLRQHVQYVIRRKQSHISISSIAAQQNISQRYKQGV